MLSTHLSNFLNIKALSIFFEGLIIRRLMGKSRSGMTSTLSIGAGLQVWTVWLIGIIMRNLMALLILTERKLQVKHLSER